MLWVNCGLWWNAGIEENDYDNLVPYDDTTYYHTYHILSSNFYYNMPKTVFLFPM